MCFEKDRENEKETISPEDLDDLLSLQATGHEVFDTFMRARALSDFGHYEEAITCWEKVIAKKPDFAEGYYNLGLAHAGLGRHEDAIGALKQSIRIKPNECAGAYLELGRVYGQQERFPEAAEAIQQAIQLKPDFVDAHMQLCIVYSTLGNIDLAVGEYHAVKKLDPEKAAELIEMFTDERED